MALLSFVTLVFRLACLIREIDNDPEIRLLEHHVGKKVVITVFFSPSFLVGNGRLQWWCW